MSAVSPALLALNEVSLQLQTVMTALNSTAIPCTGYKGESCLTTEDLRIEKLAKRGWDNYDDKRLCDACSAYWHAGVANNRVNDLIRREQLKLAE